MERCFIILSNKLLSFPSYEEIFTQTCEEHMSWFSKEAIMRLVICMWSLMSKQAKQLIKSICLFNEEAKQSSSLFLSHDYVNESTHDWFTEFHLRDTIHGIPFTESFMEHHPRNTIHRIIHGTPSTYVSTLIININNNQICYIN